MLNGFPGIDSWVSFDLPPDFSKFPNLQEVNFVFRAGWMGKGLPWIPLALSTLRPATSPRLSAIRLDFTGLVIVNGSTDAWIANTYDDLARIADEVAQLEREFEGANMTLVQGPVFRAVMETVNVSPRSRGG